MYYRATVCAMCLGVLLVGNKFLLYFLMSKLSGWMDGWMDVDRLRYTFTGTLSNKVVMTKALSTLATTVAEFGDYSRQCGQA